MGQTDAATVSADAIADWRATRSDASAVTPTRAEGGSCAPSKRTSENRRLMSSESRATTVTVGVPGGTRNCETPPSVAAVTSNQQDSSTSCTKVLEPESS